MTERDDHPPAGASPVVPLPYAAPPGPSRPGSAGDATLFDVAALALKLLGLYALMQAVPYLSYVPGLFAVRRQAEWVESVVLAIPLLLYAAIGAFLFTRAGTMAVRLVGDGAAERTVVVGRHAGRRLHAAALSVVGAFVVLLAVPDLFSAVWALSYQPDPTLSLDWESAAPSLLPAGAQIALGVWLFFGSRGVARMWRRFQGRDARPPRDTTAPPVPPPSPPPPYRGHR